MSNPIHPPRPAVAFAIFLAGGIGVCDVVPSHPWIWLVIAAVMVFFAGLVRRQDGLSNLSLGVAIIFVGLLAAQIQRYQFPRGDIRQYVNSTDRFAQVEVYLDDSPRLITGSVGAARSLPPKQTARALVTAIHVACGWRPASGKILLTLEQINPNVMAGQTLRVTGMLQSPLPPSNPGEFDFAAWAADERIAATLRVSHADAVQIVGQARFTPIIWLREKTRRLLAMGFWPERAYDHALLRAFVLGDSDPQLTDLDEKFVETGTIHCLTISGLHIAIIGSFVLFICRLLRISPRTSLWTTLIAVILYGLVATPTWPGWRSILMVAAGAIALFNRRWPDSLQLFFVAVSAILLIDPPDLHSGGFQVSFAAVLGMILFGNSIMRAAWMLWDGPDVIALGPPRQRPIASAWNGMVRFFVGSLVFGLIAWACCMPLILYHFGQFNSWSAPANVVLLPISVVALVAGVAKILLTLCWPTAAHFWAISASIPIQWLRHFVEGLDRLPGAAVATPTLPIWFLIVYYGLFAAVRLRRSRFRVRYLARIGPFVAIAALMAWPLLARSNIANPLPTSTSPKQIQITLISLGAGQCAVIRGPSNHAILIDCGSTTVADLERRLFTPYLRSVGCTSVDRIFLSHGDYDHISAAGDIFRVYSEPTIYMSPHFRRHAAGSETAESLLEMLESAHRPPTIIERGDHLGLGEGMSLDVLWPPRDCDMNSNNCGLVLKLSYGGRTVLFPADIQEPPERELLKNPAPLKCDVLVAPHHGSAELTTGDFIRAVDPKMIVASNASNLTHKQKMFDLLAAHETFYRTSRCGAITITIDANGKISLSTYLKNATPENQAMAQAELAR
jgi:competence protein ComEC